MNSNLSRNWGKRLRISQNPQKKWGQKCNWQLKIKGTLISTQNLRPNVHLPHKGFRYWWGLYCFSSGVVGGGEVACSYGTNQARYPIGTKRSRSFVSFLRSHRNYSTGLDHFYRNCSYHNWDSREDCFVDSYDVNHWLIDMLHNKITIWYSCTSTRFYIQEGL